ncbi:hypothetical protein Tco_0233326 [Tanacetum coccineum]
MIVEKHMAKSYEDMKMTKATQQYWWIWISKSGGLLHQCVVGRKRWFEKMEQVFEICKCAEDDKVKFVVCMFEGRALTWWNRNVQTLDWQMLIRSALEARKSYDGLLNTAQQLNPKDGARAYGL